MSNATDKRTHFGYREVDAREKPKLVDQVFSSVARRYDLMNDLMSLGIHRAWKHYYVTLGGFRPGERVLDLAGGTGDIALAVAERVGPTGRVVLSDINAGMLGVGRDRVVDAGRIDRIDCARINAEALPFPDRSFDAVTIAFGLRNVTDQARALAEMHRVLKLGGRALVLEFSRVRSAPFAKAYDLYSFEVLPRLGAAVAGDREAYQYLAESIRKHPDQATLEAMMRTAGFGRTDVHNLMNGMVAIHRGWRV